MMNNDELKTMLISIVSEAIQPIKDKLDTIEKELSEVKETTSRIELKQNVIYEQTGKLSEYHTENKDAMRDIKDRLNFNTYKLTETELELFKLKK